MNDTIEINDKTYVLTSKTLDKIELMVQEEFNEEYKLLSKINDNLSFEGKEYGLDYRTKKMFSVNSYNPTSCIIHFSNDIGDEIYIYKDYSIEIGKTNTSGDYKVCQLSYQNFIDIANYCKKKIEEI